jgi:phosphoglycerate dehydrogenase-like enzyme
MSWKVLITARTINEVGQTALELLRKAGCQVTIPERLGPLKASELLPQLEGHDAALVSPDQFDEPVLSSSQAAQLKIISRWGVGYDSINIAAATRLGIVVAYTPGLLNETVADFSFALLLTIARRTHVAHASMLRGEWQPVWGTDIAGKTLGLIGCGRIGQAVARRARGFNMRLLAFDVAPAAEAKQLGIEFVSLDELLGESDFISLHAALTPENRKLIGEAQFRRMKPGAYFINAARGALVDEDALVTALQQGWIAGAAVDAFTVEPLAADHPLRSAPNILLAPHQASFARETGERVSLTAAQAIVDWLNGCQPQFVVDRGVFNSPALRWKTRA